MIVRIRGRSMLPALRPGDWYWASTPKTIHRGDVIVFEKSGRFVKRVVGLPKETITLKSSQIYINGTQLPEIYVGKDSSLQPCRDQTWTLSAEEYCVLGDARDDSLDSRIVGPIDRKEITAVLSKRLWPWGRS